MMVDGKDLRTIWLSPDEKSVKIIDQRRLPHELVLIDLKTVDDAITAIREMAVRGAPLIGATGAYGVYLAAVNAPRNSSENSYWLAECDRLKSARPTAVNLAWAVDRVLQKVLQEKRADKRVAAARD
ncbi:MAG: S-methyl-5-thioribose-1-phosphate isomerase, partial [Desulfobacterales bacterium]